MWVMVMFDLPVDSREKRKVYGKFRKWLLENGYHQQQLSVYVKHCPSWEAAEAQREKVRLQVPREGQVRVLRFTDKQFGDMQVYFGKIERGPEKPPDQLSFF